MDKAAFQKIVMPAERIIGRDRGRPCPSACMAAPIRLTLDRGAFHVMCCFVRQPVRTMPHSSVQMMRSLSRSLGPVTMVVLLPWMSAGPLVLASLFITGRAPQTSAALHGNVVANGVFLMLALLMLGLGMRVRGAVQIAARPRSNTF
ncbi:hypothetical protein E7811_15390 [Aliigemmobacter aestuarii]|uniref:Uncharacterized protein n=1 Tax=Aliigemmobacter aestuarii TaxID=1445661 RepID=A0A4S3MKQ9_9RHOB|nr:hypothetical protein [Gemmobacter aestuarii]THD82425.1 hypothetical protein E7811_15390 [Gemmobacter aestuarii]